MRVPPSGAYARMPITMLSAPSKSPVSENSPLNSVSEVLVISVRGMIAVFIASGSASRPTHTWSCAGLSPAELRAAFMANE